MSRGYVVSRMKRPAAIGAAGLLLLIAACGQKPNVVLQDSGDVLPAGFTVNEEGEIVNTETGEVIGSAEELLGSGGSLGANGELESSGAGSAGTQLADEGAAGKPSAASDGTTTGVTNDTIKIGLHAPLTGAAPVPSDSVQKGSDLFFRWMTDRGHELFGRKIEVVVRNDQYNPSTAVSVCKEMVEKDEVFLLTGWAGTDQIQACARYASSVGVPYLGAGVTELVLDRLPNFFATTMTYNDQGPLLADMLVSTLGAKNEKNGMLTFDTPNFDDAREGFRAGVKEQGAKIHYDRTVPKGAGTSEARTVVQEMRTAGIENVFVLTSPVWWLNVLSQANTQQYHPQWVGMGISMTFDTVSQVGCGGGGSMDGSRFFAPFPAWIDSKRYDPEFGQAVERFHPEERGGDDFMWLLWSESKAIWEILENVGAKPTRERFIYDVERMRKLDNAIGPTLSFSPDDHFGANEVHVSEARCSDRRWHTIKSFVSDF